MEIHCFVHLAIMNDWERIYREQLAKIVRSGLSKLLDGMHISMVGAEEDKKIPLLAGKAEIEYQSPNLKEYEFPTLKLIKNFSQNVDAKILYLHSKGVSKFGQVEKPYVEDWRNYLEYFVIERYQNCLEALETVSVCGANWALAPLPHFSGNFWWARSDYIRTLPEPVWREQRIAAELWLGTRNPTVMNLFSSNVDHYNERFPRERYI